MFSGELLRIGTHFLKHICFSRGLEGGTTQGKKTIARFLVVVQAWVKLRSQSAKGANSYKFCQNSCSWEMTPQQQLHSGTAFSETKGSWVPVVDWVFSAERCSLEPGELLSSSWSCFNEIRWS